MTTTGQVLGAGVGLRDCLDAVRDAFYGARFAGLACAIKNSGIGNGVTEVSETRLKVVAPDRIELQHGWTELGQGVHTVARQVLCEVVGLDGSIKIDIKCSTDTEVIGGMTTASRATPLLGNSVIDAAKKLAADLEDHSLADLVGKEYFGRYVVDWTTSHDVDGEIRSHFSYAYAAHLAVLDDQGKLQTIYAAHDGGRIINPALFESQIQGGVVMGMGYALSEQLPLEGGRLTTDRMSELGLSKAKDVPEIKVIGVECPDPIGPFGAKGIGEIGTIPTAPAIANAYCRYDGHRRYTLPLSPPARRTNSKS
jgi:xanthine dehydrogenase molybdenum-binding subunit